MGSPHITQANAQRAYHECIYVTFPALASSSNIDSSVSPNSLEVCDSISGVAVPNNTEDHALTQFVNESCDSAVVRGSQYRLPANAYTDSPVRSVKEYLERPFIITNGSYNAATRSVMWSYTPSLSSFQSIIPNFNRLSGTFGMRFTMCLRLQVAAQPFQAGLLRLCYQPPFSGVTTFDSTLPNFNANFASQLPGVYLDICEDTAVEFRVPWVNAVDFVPYNAFTSPLPSNFGQFTLFAYLPVSVPGGGAVPFYTVWFWLEDLEMIAAVPDNCSLLTPQAGDPMTKETGAGPITRLLGATVRVAEIAGSIPLISAYAGPAAWALRIGQKVAAAFGWSKPRVLLPPGRMINTFNTFQNCGDGHDAAYPLSILCDNHVEALPGFAGSNVDEMALAFLLSQWALCANFSLQQSDITGRLKYGCNVCPGALWYQGSSNWGVVLPTATLVAQKAALTTPLYYIGQCFRLWRGCIKFRLRAAKTKFHTGRLIIGFTPRVTLDGGLSTNQFLSPSVLSSPMAYKSVVWDLRESNVLEFEVPFLSPVSYLNILDSIGDLTVLVLDPLNGPPTVATNINFAVEVAACPDFEFAVPTTPVYFPSPKAVTSSSGAGLIAQAGFEPYTVDTFSGARTAIGERILSIKQLMSRACFSFPVNPILGSVTAFNFPWFWNGYADAFYTGSPPTNITYNPGALGYSPYFSRMFSFARGSSSFDVIPTGNTLLSAVNPGQLHRQYTSLVSGGVIYERHTALHVTVPYYSTTTRSIINNPNTNKNYTVPAGGCTGVVSGTSSDKPGCAMVYSRCGDDAQLGYFLGSPPLDCPNPASAALLTNTVAEAQIMVVPATQ